MASLFHVVLPYLETEMVVTGYALYRLPSPIRVVGRAAATLVPDAKVTDRARSSTSTP